jgi:pyrimidine deaminase RibD-like protein
VALAKASEQQVELRGATLYTSLEPCSQRRSPRTPCTDRLIATGIARVVYALREPPVFVKCRGLERLAAHGIEIVHYAEFEEQVRAANRHLLSRLPGLDMPPGSATQ